MAAAIQPRVVRHLWRNGHIFCTYLGPARESTALFLLGVILFLAGVGGAAVELNFWDAALLVVGALLAVKKRPFWRAR